jgi:hypothetical protein
MLLLAVATFGSFMLGRHRVTTTAGLSGVHRMLRTS